MYHGSLPLRFNVTKLTRNDVLKLSTGVLQHCGVQSLPQLIHVHAHTEHIKSYVAEFKTTRAMSIVRQTKAPTQ